MHNFLYKHVRLYREWHYMGRYRHLKRMRNKWMWFKVSIMLRIIVGSILLCWIIIPWILLNLVALVSEFLVKELNNRVHGVLDPVNSILGIEASRKRVQKFLRFHENWKRKFYGPKIGKPIKHIDDEE